MIATQTGLVGEQLLHIVQQFKLNKSALLAEKAPPLKTYQMEINQ